MAKQTIHKFPTPPVEQSEEQPKKRWPWRRQKIRNIHEGQILFNGTYFDRPEWELNRTRAQIIRDGLRDIFHDLNKIILEFFKTCLGEIVLLCIFSFMVAGFIVLILKLTGNL